MGRERGEKKRKLYKISRKRNEFRENKKKELIVLLSKQQR